MVCIWSKKSSVHLYKRSNSSFCSWSPLSFKTRLFMKYKPFPLLSISILEIEKWSFFRKLYIGAHPLKPDRQHLHMLSYNFLDKSQKFKDCNYLNSLMINLVYISLILPAIFFNDNGLICRYWFFSLLLIYLVTYYLFYSFLKKQ